MVINKKVVSLRYFAFAITEFFHKNTDTTAHPR